MRLVFQHINIFPFLLKVDTLKIQKFQYFCVASHLSEEIGIGSIQYFRSFPKMYSQLRFAFTPKDSYLSTKMKIDFVKL